MSFQLTKCYTIPSSRDSISWLFKFSYIKSVYSQCHVDLKCTKQNVNNRNLTQVSQLYVHVSFGLKVIRTWLNLPTGGHGHVICMGDHNFATTQAIFEQKRLAWSLECETWQLHVVKIPGTSNSRNFYVANFVCSTLYIPNLMKIWVF